MFNITSGLVRVLILKLAATLAFLKKTCQIVKIVEMKSQAVFCAFYKRHSVYIYTRTLSTSLSNDIYAAV